MEKMDINQMEKNDADWLKKQAEGLQKCSEIVEAILVEHRKSLQALEKARNIYASVSEALRTGKNIDKVQAESVEILASYEIFIIANLEESRLMGDLTKTLQEYIDETCENPEIEDIGGYA